MFFDWRRSGYICNHKVFFLSIIIRRAHRTEDAPNIEDIPSDCESLDFWDVRPELQFYGEMAPYAILSSMGQGDIGPPSGRWLGQKYTELRRHPNRQRNEILVSLQRRTKTYFAAVNCFFASVRKYSGYAGRITKCLKLITPNNVRKTTHPTSIRL